MHGSRNPHHMMRSLRCRQRQQAGSAEREAQNLLAGFEPQPGQGLERCAQMTDPLARGHPCAKLCLEPNNGCGASCQQFSTLLNLRGLTAYWHPLCRSLGSCATPLWTVPRQQSAVQGGERSRCHTILLHATPEAVIMQSPSCQPEPVIVFWRH